MINRLKKILVVDDDEEIVRGTTVRLRSAGYQTIAAFNGADAINGAKRNRPDAILLDVRMPGLDGLAVLKQLQEADDTCRVPVIMLSASLCDQRTALNAGARFFLAKPYRGDELLEVVQHVTAHSEPSGPNMLARTVVLN
jgi:DNA-binding response OmpR family regulator